MTQMFVEVAASLDLGGGFSVFVGGSFAEDFEQFSIEHYNAYVTYETGAWLFAAELNATNADFEGDNYLHAGLLMANYEYSDVASVTARVSAIDLVSDSSDNDNDLEATKYTLAHNYAFSDNLLLVTEVSHVDFSDSEGPFDMTQFAVELLFIF